jgi:D-alanyl-D-alanine carboxypeptidase
MIRNIVAAGASLLLCAQASSLAVSKTEGFADTVVPERITPVVDASRLAGTVLIAKGDKIVYERAFGFVDPAGQKRHRLGQVWRYASVTKQWAATLAMQEVAAGRLDLDAPISTYLTASKAPFASAITARMLMQHVSGLPRTEDSPLGADGWSQFYRLPEGSPGTGMSFCEGPTDRKPIAEFRYGDCDFIVLGALLEKITGKSLETLVDERFRKPLSLKSVGLFPRRFPTIVGYEGGKRESSQFRLENFGAAGALYGTTHDLFAFDRALMTGKLVPDAQREIMWTGNPKLGFAAFGQWAFSSPIKGCGDTPIRFIERRGAIGGVVLRNLILPEQDIVIIMTSNRAEADAAFGEIWQQRGISHDVISAALCRPAGQ